MAFEYKVPKFQYFPVPNKRVVQINVYSGKYSKNNKHVGLNNRAHRNLNLWIRQIEYDNLFTYLDIYSAANFCFNKDLCMIWNEGTLGKDKSC